MDLNYTEMNSVPSRLSNSMSADVKRVFNFPGSLLPISSAAIIPINKRSHNRRWRRRNETREETKDGGGKNAARCSHVCDSASLSCGYLLMLYVCLDFVLQL